MSLYQGQSKIKGRQKKKKVDLVLSENCCKEAINVEWWKLCRQTQKVCTIDKNDMKENTAVIMHPLL